MQESSGPNQLTDLKTALSNPGDTEVLKAQGIRDFLDPGLESLSASAQAGP